LRGSRLRRLAGAAALSQMFGAAIQRVTGDAANSASRSSYLVTLYVMM